jgi:hypothetical protein
MRAAVLAVLTAAALVAHADQPPGDRPAALLGKWHASGSLPGKDGAPGMGWQLEYTLAGDGSFKMTGYPPIAVTGRWAVPERDGRKLRIVLTEQKMGGGAWPDRDGWAELSDDGKSLKWQDKTFTRR